MSLVVYCDAGHPREVVPNEPAHLAGDRLLDRPTVGDARAGRTRGKLECPVCGYSVVGRNENLIPIFKKLADAGVSEVSLAALAARLPM